MTDYLFLFSNAPAPGLLDKVRIATEAGRRPLVLYLERSHELLCPDLPKGCRCVAFPAPFEGVSFRRAGVLISFIIWLRKILKEELINDVDCYTDSLDLLASTVIAANARRLRYRFEVRDLHRVQLRPNIIRPLVRAAERLLFPRVHTLVLTSKEYWSSYYKKLHPKRCIIVENMPLREAWEGFRRLPSASEFRIGFIGVLRYVDCLKALIVAVRMLRKDGHLILVRFAGGGDISEVKDFSEDDPFIEFTGSYRYSADIQRIYSDLDLIYSVYDSRDANVRCAMPNKFYEAIISRIPIVVASGTYLESRVRAQGIGIGVPCLDPVAIAAALRTAVLRRGWYLDAERRLLSDLAAPIYAEHRKSIVRAVLGRDEADPENNCVETRDTLL